jgi:hypothetical protein
MAEREITMNQIAGKFRVHISGTDTAFDFSNKIDAEAGIRLARQAIDVGMKEKTDEFCHALGVKPSWRGR